MMLPAHERQKEFSDHRVWSLKAVSLLLKERTLVYPQPGLMVVVRGMLRSGVTFLSLRCAMAGVIYSSAGTTSPNTTSATPAGVSYPAH
jgi:hypothetical protein